MVGPFKILQSILTSRYVFEICDAWMIVSRGFFIQLGLRILFFVVYPVVNIPASFACPISASDIEVRSLVPRLTHVDRVLRAWSPLSRQESFDSSWMKMWPGSPTLYIFLDKDGHVLLHSYLDTDLYEGQYLPQLTIYWILASHNYNSQLQPLPAEHLKMQVMKSPFLAIIGYESQR